MTESMNSEGLSRRDVLKRSVVAGGLVWAAPTILASPAAAQTSTGACPNCPTGQLYGLKFDSANFTATGDFQACTSIGSGRNPATCIEQPTGGVASGCCLLQEPHKLIDASASGGVTTVTLQPGVQFCSGATKGGNNTGDPCLTGPPAVTWSTDSNGVTTVTLTQSNQSHTEIIVCHRGSPPLGSGCRGT